MASAKKKTPWWVRAWFFGLLALAVGYAIPTLAYPFGPDQAASYYIGREWWQHDLIPYRDAVDLRTPGIHFVYMLATALFGAHPWSIRILELVALVGGGSAIAKAAARRSLTAVEVAPVILLFVGACVAFVGVADSGQAEIWEALCLVAGQSILSIDKNRRRAAIVAGLWTGCAVVFEPHALFLVPILFAQAIAQGLLDRPEPEKLPTVVEITAAYWLGFVQPPAAFLAYFATRDSTAPLYECILQHVPSHEPWFASMRAFATHAWPLLATAFVLWAIGLVSRIKQQKSSGLWTVAVAPLSLLAAVASVCAGGSANGSAWVVLVPFVVLCAADGLAALGRVQRLLPTMVALASVALFHLAAPAWSSGVDASTRTLQFWRYAVGSSDRSAYLHAVFQGDPEGAYADAEDIGNLVRDLARPTDRLHVRGKDAGIYVVSGLRSPSRYFADEKTTDEPFVATEPPRFFVTRATALSADAAELGRRGYREMARVGPFVLFAL